MTTSTRRMPLPRPLRASVMTEMEPAFAAVVAASLLLHVAMVLYLRGVDWPRRPELEEISVLGTGGARFEATTSIIRDGRETEPTPRRSWTRS